MSMELVALVAAVAVPFAGIALAHLLSSKMSGGASKSSNSGAHHLRKIGFLHPYCYAGGGGERVLWCTVRAFAKLYPHARFVIYAVKCKLSANEILDKANITFGVQLPRENIEFEFINADFLINTKYMTHCTMLLQLLGSAIFALVAFWRQKTEIVVDTMGLPMSYVPLKLLYGAQVFAYVHYPWISTDMVDSIQSGKAGFNNKTSISKSKILTSFKIAYYRMLMFAYTWSGSCCDVAMVNSTWTLNHMTQVWNGGHEKISIVYPPCDVVSLQQSATAKDLKKTKRSNIMLSLAQFRPEKGHELQVRSFARARKAGGPASDLRLVLIGGCRNEDDYKRVDSLRNLADELGVSDCVEFIVNADNSTVQEYLMKSVIGLHTMESEHFGISIVEYMASGLITIANRSGGPLLDIIQESVSPQRGFLARTEHEYAEKIHFALKLSHDQAKVITNAAKEAALQYSEDEFEKALLAIFSSKLEVLSSS